MTIQVHRSAASGSRRRGTVQPRVGVLPGPDRLRALLESLRGPNRPGLDTVLHPGDIFADLTVGGDLGYHDSITITITIASHSDLTSRLHHLTNDYDRRIARYEEEVDALPDIATFLAAMPDLTGLDTWSGSRSQAAGLKDKLWPERKDV